jgi:hypothetical protein
MAKKRKKRKAAKTAKSTTKRRKSTKKRKRPVTKAAPAKRKRKAAKRAAPAKPKRKKRKLSAAHLAKLQAGRLRALAHKRKHGPALTAKVGERARSPWDRPLAAPRFPIRNPKHKRKAHWVFKLHKGVSVRTAVGKGSQTDAHTTAQSLMARTGASKVEVLGPFSDPAQYARYLH